MNAALISRFTPSMLSRDSLEALFVQRQDLAKRSVELIRESVLTPSKHHTLLVGPRGIGKTHVVSVVYHRVVEDEELRERMVVAWLREEEWGVSSYLDLLLRLLRALCDHHHDKDLATRVDKLYELPKDEAESEARVVLEEYVGSRVLLVIVENLDELFKGLGDEGQKRLRAYLQEHHNWTILATATSLFNGVSLQTSPFYGFFRIEHLAPLTLEEAIELLEKIARHAGNHELARIIGSPMGRARIRAIEVLAGGNHRVYVICSQFLTRDSLDDLVDLLMRTMDDLTPYYQSRMSSLPAQQRKIVSFLIDYRAAAQVKVIAQRCFISHQTASSQLKALRDMGYVVSKQVGRDSYYELREPLMRLCMEIKKSYGKPIKMIVDFLRVLYSADELKMELELLHEDAAFDRECLLAALQELEAESEDPRVEACNRDLQRHAKSGAFEKALSIADDLIAIRGDWEDWAARAYFLGQLKRNEEAVVATGEVLDRDPDNEMFWTYKGTLLALLGRHEECIACQDRALALDARSETACASRGAALGNTGRHREALECFDKVILLAPEDTEVWYNRGVCLHQLENDVEAVRCFEKVVRLEPENETAWAVYAQLLIEQNRGPELVESYEKAIADGHPPHSALPQYVAVLSESMEWDELLTRVAQVSAQVGRQTPGLAAAIANVIITALRCGQDSSGVGRRVSQVVSMCESHEMIEDLRSGLVLSMGLVVKAEASDRVLAAWRDAWRDVAAKHPGFDQPLRLLDVAIPLRHNEDRRALLDLPVEDRKILESLLSLSTDGSKDTGSGSGGFMGVQPHETSDEEQTH